MKQFWLLNSHKLNRSIIVLFYTLKTVARYPSIYTPWRWGFRFNQMPTIVDVHGKVWVRWYIMFRAFGVGVNLYWDNYCPF